MKRYTTAEDAIAQEITPALAEYAEDFNTTAIFQELFEYKVDTNEQGQELANTAGFERITEDNETFWEIVQKHDVSK